MREYTPGTRVREAFDRHALLYDERFSSVASARSMRRDVWQIADATFSAGSRLLDIGCGTGEDAVHLVRNGSHVTAVDIAPAMVAQLLQKVGALGLHSHIESHAGDIETFEHPGDRFDGIFSNFGPLNCTAGLGWLPKLAARSLKSGAPVILVTMGRLYPLETAVFLLKGDIGNAFRRLRRSPAVRIEGVDVPVYYHSPRALRRAFGPDFSLLRLVGLRSLLPVPSLDHLERFLPLRIMKPLDSLITQFPLTAACADHFVSVWRYR